MTIDEQDKLDMGRRRFIRGAGTSALAVSSAAALATTGAAAPMRNLPGTTMPFGGLKKTGQRDALNCYLKTSQ